MQVKHLLLLVVLILLIPPGFYWLMNSKTQKPDLPTLQKYEVVRSEQQEKVNVEIKDSTSIDTPYFEKVEKQIKTVPTWLVQDANFQGCVTRAIENCVSDTTQQEVQALQSDTLCDALKGAEAESCKNQFNYTKAVKNKDIGLCEKITNDFQKVACQNGVFTQNALENRDPRWCDKIVSAAGPASTGLISPEKQNCLNLLDLQGVPTTGSNWDSGLQETVLD